MCRQVGNLSSKIGLVTLIGLHHVALDGQKMIEVVEDLTGDGQIIAKVDGSDKFLRSKLRGNVFIAKCRTKIVYTAENLRLESDDTYAGSYTVVFGFCELVFELLT